MEEYVCIEEKELNEMIESKGKEWIKEKLYSMNISYPFAKYLHLDPITLFEYVRSTDLDISKEEWETILPYKYENKFMGEYFRYWIENNHYYLGNVITDIFSENIRLKCRVKKRNHIYPSPLDAWKNKDIFFSVLDHCIEKYRCISAYSLRHTLYNTKLIKECNLYKVMVVRNLISMMKAKSVLDLSTGWGDRLIGALAADVNVYHGCDPNPELQESYRNIIKTFGKGKDVSIEMKTMEEYKPPHKKYDIFHSSPPFWSKEVYIGTRIESSPKEWVNSFLIPYVDKGYSYVRPGGIFSIYIDDIPEARYCDRMNDHMKSKGAKYLGVIGVGHFCIWMWKKPSTCRV